MQGREEWSGEGVRVGIRVTGEDCVSRARRGDRLVEC